MLDHVERERQQVYREEPEGVAMKWIVEYKPIFDLLATLIQAVGVVYLIIYTTYTGQQRDASRKALDQTIRSNDLTQQTLVLSYRAWLKVSLDGNVFKGNSLNRNGPGITINNIGRIPTNSVQCTTKVALEPAGDPSMATTRTWGPLPIGIGEGIVIPLDLAFLDPFPGGVLAGPGRSVLHVTTAVNYEDGFGGARKMHFAWRLNLTPSGGESWNIIDRHVE
jgi:hypothetical protein